MTSFSQLIAKLAEGSTTLTSTEKHEITLQAQQMEQMVTAVGKLFTPGSSRLSVDNASINNAQINLATINSAEINSANAGNGEVILDDTGISINTPDVATADLNAYKFVNTAGDALAGLYGYTSGGSIILVLQTVDAGGAIAFLCDSSGIILQDGWIKLNHNGNDVNTSIQWNSGTSVLVDGGTGEIYAYQAMVLDDIDTPTTTLTNEGEIYVKGGKFVIRYNDGGTVRYKYLDLTGTGVTWVHSTTAP